MKPILLRQSPATIDELKQLMIALANEQDKLADEGYDEQVKRGMAMAYRNVFDILVNEKIYKELIEEYNINV